MVFFERKPCKRWRLAVYTNCENAVSPHNFEAQADHKRSSVMSTPTLSELAIIDVLNTIVDRVKQTQPATTTGKPLSGGLVYSQLVLGMPIDPRDYGNPWSPMGGSSGVAQQQQQGVPVVKGQPDPN